MVRGRVSTMSTTANCPDHPCPTFNVEQEGGPWTLKVTLRRSRAKPGAHPRALVWGPIIMPKASALFNSH
jgi:hypothetical protein